VSPFVSFCLLFVVPLRRDIVEFWERFSTSGAQNDTHQRSKDFRFDFYWSVRIV
jgi:hypothetical protein